MKRNEMHDEYDYSHTQSSEGDASKKFKPIVAQRNERGFVKQAEQSSEGVTLFLQTTYMQHNRRIVFSCLVESDDSSNGADFSCN